MSDYSVWAEKPPESVSRDVEILIVESNAAELGYCRGIQSCRIEKRLALRN